MNRPALTSYVVLALLKHMSNTCLLYSHPDLFTIRYSSVTLTKTKCDSFALNREKTGDEQPCRLSAWTTIDSKVDEISTPLGEKRNSVLSRVETGHQSLKREEMELNDELDAVTLLAGCYG
jgi:hypothetical protein